VNHDFNSNATVVLGDPSGLRVALAGAARFVYPAFAVPSDACGRLIAHRSAFGKCELRSEESVVDRLTVVSSSLPHRRFIQ
jgi:hypothetical protein